LQLEIIVFVRNLAASNLFPEKSRFLQRDADAKATYQGLIPAPGDLLHLDIEAESNLYPEKSNFHRDDADC
jgi:hypothetical protein